MDDNEANTIADRQLLRAMKGCEDFVGRWLDEGHSLDSLVTHIYNRMTFIYHEINDEGIVYTVFEVLNSRGLPVPWFDRLKSKLMSLVFESEDTDNNSEIIDEIHGLWGEIYRIVGLRIGLSAELLRFAATLHAETAPSRPLGERAAVDLLQKEASESLSDVVSTTKWIKSVAEAVDRVREDHRLNAVTDIQQARLVATAIHLNNTLGVEDKEIILRRWESVTFRIYGMYGKDARTAVGDYTRLAWHTVKGGYSRDDILKELSRIGRKIPG